MGQAKEHRMTVQSEAREGEERESSFCQWEWETGQALIRASAEEGQIQRTHVLCP
jgi:hypothetical protein